MNVLYVVLFFAIFGAVMSFVGGKLKEKRAGSEKYQQLLENFRQQAEAMLEEGETLDAMCGYKPCAAVTSKRLLVQSKGVIDSVPFQQIKKVKGMDFSGNKTSDPERMLVLEIKAEKKYVIGNHSEGFAAFVKALTQRVTL